MNQIFSALSDPTRRAILTLLRQGEKSAGELAEPFHISKPSISHHLQTLKAAGLVLDDRRGQQIFYSLNTTVFQDVLSWMLEMTDRGESRQVSREEDNQ
ncbi:winged helix-turn-helix transcriptional regulator [Heliobacterium chlorum]|uniref:Winged helix-turn-helix transcriptional regulator n=1 Tax=Heliobacterium chlorum TaxID=2698 RepID=A0ABR7T238_HELCL|nr:autorepressor SdpR family transcription factor [Heliobacterium chlorum]MBC9784030.1 winged helix-turn-helix transcriptional regulator [Heliobacterium chlorum]